MSRMPNTKIDAAVRNCLECVYGQMMWLAKQPDETPSLARAWYTHVWAGKFAGRVRHFTGKVFRAAAADSDADLRLEHYLRIQTKLTKLVERHLRSKRPAPAGFVRLVLECERVHIVTRDENYAAMRADGDYRAAGIRLVSWGSLPEATRQALWKKMLRRRVANADEYKL